MRTLAQSAGKERLRTGGQLCSFGKGAGCAEVEVGRQGRTCCNVGRWQSRARGAREHRSGEMSKDLKTHPCGEGEGELRSKRISRAKAGLSPQRG